MHLDEDYKVDDTLQNVYVMMGAFEDGDEIVPVKLAVKEFSDKQNTLYVTLTANGIKNSRGLEARAPPGRRRPKLSLC